MLKGFGWNVVRIWSLEWWENPDKVFEKLIQLINDSQKEGALTEEAPAEEVPSDSTETADAVPEEEGGPEVIIYGQETEETAAEEPEASDDQTQKKTAELESGTSDGNPARASSCVSVRSRHRPLP